VNVIISTLKSLTLANGDALVCVRAEALLWGTHGEMILMVKNPSTK